MLMTKQTNIRPSGYIAPEVEIMEAAMAGLLCQSAVGGSTSDLVDSNDFNTFDDLGL